MRNSEKYVTLRKVGGFYQCFDGDCYILYYLFNYKIVNKRCGFPHSSLSKVINVLEDKKIDYKVINHHQDDIGKSYKKINQYNHFLKLGLEKYDRETKKSLIENKIKAMPMNRIEELYHLIEDFVNEY